MNIYLERVFELNATQCERMENFVARGRGINREVLLNEFFSKPDEVAITYTIRDLLLRAQQEMTIQDRT